MFELLGAAIGGAFSYFGAKEQTEAAQETAFFQMMLMQNAGKRLKEAYDEVVSDIEADPRGYAGSKVRAAEYNNVDTAESQRSGVEGNIGNLDVINQLVGQTNRATLENDRTRADFFAPGTSDTLSQLSRAALGLSSGQLPDDVVQDIISDRSSRAAALGTPGGSGAATLRDLGLNSLDAISRGSDLMRANLAAAESISPISRQIAAPQFFISPQEKLNTDLQQAQLDQNSRQNKYNLDAAPDPGKNLMAQLKIQGANQSAAIRAGVAGIPQPQFPSAQVYGAIGNSIGNAIANLGNGGGGGYGGGYNTGFGSSQGGFNPAAYNAYATSYNQNLSSGQAPKAIVVT